ncbi:MAG: hypothetical protein JOY76_12335 [Hyphomicrobiales bacterium]|nr:hypothetical protein [Hyphomicrobiales bacterium]MBV8428926.1 hypothetical protein [Hyphomicrobiales bacterium]
MRYRPEGDGGDTLARAEKMGVVEPGVPPEEYGRFANLGLLTVVLLIAALWLAFPPTQLSGPTNAGTVLAQSSPATDLPR